MKSEKLKMKDVEIMKNQKLKIKARGIYKYSDEH